jgi:hypothetical protein
MLSFKSLGYHPGVKYAKSLTSKVRKIKKHCIDCKKKGLFFGERKDPLVI